MKWYLIKNSNESVIECIFGRYTKHLFNKTKVRLSDAVSNSKGEIIDEYAYISKPFTSLEVILMQTGEENNWLQYNFQNGNVFHYFLSSLFLHIVFEE